MLRNKLIDSLPDPSPKRLAVKIKAPAERALKQGHPWIFDGAIKKLSSGANPGSLAVIFDAKDKFLAIGLYDPNNPIRIRVLAQGKPTPIDQDWFINRVTTALSLRKKIFIPGKTTGFRLIHGENDGMPGLVLDHYDRTLSLKIYSCAWIPYLKQVLAALIQVVSFDRLVLRLGREIQKSSESLYGLFDGMILLGPDFDGEATFLENGLKFTADLIKGQKTGFFLDQRDNRTRVGQMAAGKTVLNVFSYTGGFSLYAARGGAKSVMDVDASKGALGFSRRNFALNEDNENVAQVKHELIADDAFSALRKLRESKRKFDIVIIDPPSFAPKQSDIPKALQAYARLASLGLQVLQPGGELVMASCTSRVASEAFFETVLSALAKAGGRFHEIARTGHPADHPISFKEGSYLKCIYLDFARKVGKNSRAKSQPVE